MAYSRARADVRESGSLPVPLKFRSAQTGLAKSLGYGKDYKYPHEFSGNYVVERYLPNALSNRVYYTPSHNGEERVIAERMKAWREQCENDPPGL